MIGEEARSHCRYRSGESGRRLKRNTGAREPLRGWPPKHSRRCARPSGPARVRRARRVHGMHSIGCNSASRAPSEKVACPSDTPSCAHTRHRAQEIPRWVMAAAESDAAAVVARGGESRDLHGHMRKRGFITEVLIMENTRPWADGVELSRGAKHRDRLGNGIGEGGTDASPASRRVVIH